MSQYSLIARGLLPRIANTGVLKLEDRTIMKLGRIEKHDPENKKQRVILVQTESKSVIDLKLKWASR